MKIAAFVSVLFFAFLVRAQSSVTITVGDHATGPAIPADFPGLSFEISNLLPGKNGEHLFNADNKDLINLFRTIGIKNLRVGGGTADLPEYAIPTPPDIDQLFAFAKAADVRIIYVLRLLNGNAAADAKIAQYIQQHYASQIVCFQIGNEPDWHSFHSAPRHPMDPRIVETIPGQPGSAYPSFLADWRTFAAVITVAAPDAKFSGPDTGSDYPVPDMINTDYQNQSWTEHFARDEKARLLFVTPHDYPGQSAADVSIPTAISSMLSKEWPEKRYAVLFNHSIAPVLKQGLCYRMTEANDYTGGVNGASNAFASALWALDYLHWHAARGAVGVNFHNKAWIYTDTVYRDRTGFHFNPKAYAFRAFNAANHGSPHPCTITNAQNLNLTAYAIRGDHELYVTLINKEFGPDAHEAAVTIIAKGITGRATAMFLKSPNNDVTARTGITLGDAAITTDSWDDHWSDRNECKDNQTTVSLPPATAVVIKLATNE